jgi:hypothetical protein
MVVFVSMRVMPPNEISDRRRKRPVGCNNRGQIT